MMTNFFYISSYIASFVNYDIASILYFSFRAINIEQLIASIGGYIGLCLGYSIVQIPEMLINVSACFKNYFL